MNQSSNKRMLLIGAGILFLLFAAGLFLALRPGGQKATQKQQLDAQQKALAKSPYADPVLQYLPYGGLGYNINSTLTLVNNKYVLTLVVGVTFDGADLRSSPADQAAAIKSREQAALDYIRSKGLDPSKYRVEYRLPSAGS